MSEKEVFEYDIRKKKCGFIPPEFSFLKGKGDETKENQKESEKAVYAAFVCEFTFYNRDDENEFVQETELLGIYTDPAKAEKICDDYGPKNSNWKAINPSFIPWYEEHKRYSSLKSEYQFNTDHTYFSLTIRNKVVMEIELDKFNRLDLNYANFMSQETYERILDEFRRYRYEIKSNRSRLENGIHKIMEMEG